MKIYRKPPLVLPTSHLPYLSMSSAGGSKMRVPKTMYIVCFILVVGIILTVLNVYELRAMQKEHYDKNHFWPSVEGELDPSGNNKRRPILWVVAKHPDSGYLNHVLKVFSRLGYVRGNGDSWDVLWHHDYPFLNVKMQPILHNLLPHQKVNHIPGSGFYTSKVNLAVSNISGIPPAFSLPKQKEEFMTFAKKHPEKYWVQKSNKHRGVQIKQIQDFDLSQDNSFIQEYIAKPLLIDKRKFDIGIYTIVTSVSPLRVYLYEGDALLRFCPKDYHPFDPSDTDKYVVSDDYTPTWKIKSLSKYYTDDQMTFKESLNAYLRAEGKNPDKIWTAIRSTIRQVLNSKYAQMRGLLDKYKQTWNFFELSRFDFVLDEELNVYLMEANMSPNLSSGHFPPNRLLYEQVLFNLFSVAGVARSVHSDSLINKSPEDKEMLASEKDLHTHQSACTERPCDTCGPVECGFCHKCLTPSRTTHLRNAYLEHLNRLNTRRLIPDPFPNQEEAGKWEKFEKYLGTLETEEDKIQASWFRAKCLQDSTWCN